MSLKLYNKKRNFLKTAEPKGKINSRKNKSLLFVVQRHQASHLHYDFRLELDGVLKSWAIPKGPSNLPGDKRLAVHVEDHPYAYWSFTGTIPAGEYGGGKVTRWDVGTWVPQGDPRLAYNKGKLEFELKGKKMKGRWVLLQMSGRSGQEGKNWLLIKSKDQNPTFVEEKSSKANTNLSFVKPQLATLTSEIPEGNDWIHEMKFDGYRALSYVMNHKATIFTRSGQDWTYRFPTIAKALQKLKVQEALLDGEIVKFLPNGLTSFQALQNSLSEKEEKNLYYYLFDILTFNGKDLRKLALTKRRQALKNLIKKQDVLRVSEELKGSSLRIFNSACRQGLEGIVSKRKEQSYISGRSKDWVKVKCHKEQEFVIVGFTDPKNSRQFFGALVMGIRDPHNPHTPLKYAGLVGTGFTQTSLRELHQKLKPLEQSTPTLKLPRTAKAKGVHWVKPILVAQIEFTQWTNDGIARHPSFKGLREDKLATEVIREASRKKEEDLEIIGGIKITHPDKVLYKNQRITKRDLAQYYDEYSEKILPYIKGHPISLLRCPEGNQKKCFFQKHVVGTPPEIASTLISDLSGQKNKYVVVNDKKGLIALAQMGVLEIHPWGSQVASLEKPDMMVFDLDPDPNVEWPRVIEGARIVHFLLKELGLKSFLKTTGGKGLHIVCPLAKKNSWEEVKMFSRTVAKKIADEDPQHFTIDALKSKRRGKIFIDYLRNTRGATSIAPYSPRATQNGPISTPLFWEELTPQLKSNVFTMGNIRERITSLSKDPWKDFHNTKQTINNDMKKKLSLT